MIPKIEFVYSRVYDKRYRENKNIQKILKKREQKYPSEKKIKNYIKRAEKEWKKQGRKILAEMSKIMSLKWKEEKIKCYIIGSGRSFSDPLTVKLSKNLSDFINTLTHEMIHQLQTQNIKRMKKWWNYVYRKYKKEPELTKNHILLHSVHKKLYLKIFNKNRLKRNIKRDDTKPDYEHSWEIVEREGYENIIERFHKITR